eukprot:1354206-Amorphochlora_amoeboformis.AAC.1
MVRSERRMCVVICQAKDAAADFLFLKVSDIGNGGLRATRSLQLYSPPEGEKLGDVWWTIFVRGDSSRDHVGFCPRGWWKIFIPLRCCCYSLTEKTMRY